MGRINKVFIYRKFWRTKIGGRLTAICPESVSLSEANEKMQSLLVDYRSAQKKLVPEAGSVREVVDKYLASKVCAPLTLVKLRQHLRTLLIMYGDRQLVSITSQDSEVWAGRLSSLKGGSFNGYLKSARALWAWSMKKQYVLANPFKTIDLKEEGRRERIVSEGEWRSLWSVASQEWRHMLLFFRWSACRPQDLYQAQWSWLSTCGRYITIPVQNHKTGRKTGQTRTLFLPPVLQKLVAYRSVRRSGDTIFSTSLSCLDSGFRRLCVKAGVKEGTEKLVFYSLRHTRLTELGMDKKLPLEWYRRSQGINHLSRFGTFILTRRVC